MPNNLVDFQKFLLETEKSSFTIEKYLRDIRMFNIFMQNKLLTQLELVDFKNYLSEHYAPRSVNSIIAAVNTYLKWLGLDQLKIKSIKLQKEIFIDQEKELSEFEYKKLIKTAEKEGDFRLSLLMQTICSTGIRVSELQYITTQSLHIGQTNVKCKGKNRVVFLPKTLCKLLKNYCKKNAITSGSIFITKNGKPLDRSNIWKMMKNLCLKAGVKPSKVFPHNLRHLFARTYYKIEKDISRLADILGHADINTTRIYTMESGKKHARQIDKMGLIFS